MDTISPVRRVKTRSHRYNTAVMSLGISSLTVNFSCTLGTAHLSTVNNHTIVTRVREFARLTKLGVFSLGTQSVIITGGEPLPF